MTNYQILDFFFAPDYLQSVQFLSVISASSVLAFKKVSIALVSAASLCATIEGQARSHIFLSATPIFFKEHFFKNSAVALYQFLHLFLRTLRCTKTKLVFLSCVQKNIGQIIAINTSKWQNWATIRPGRSKLLHFGDFLIKNFEFQ